MKINILLLLCFSFLLFGQGCKPTISTLPIPDADDILMEYLKTDLPISRYILEGKVSLNDIDTLPDFEVRLIRPSFLDFSITRKSCLIIQDLKNGKCYSACQPNIYSSKFGGNSRQDFNPIAGIGDTPDIIFYHKDHCSNLTALEAFLNDKYVKTGIPKGFLEVFLNTYFSYFTDVEQANYEALEKLVRTHLNKLDEKIEGKDFIQGYSWELASTLTKIKEAERISNVYAQYIYINFGLYGVAIRVYRIPIIPFEESLKNEDTGPFQYRIVIDEI